MSALTILDESPSPFTARNISDEERRCIEANIRSLRAGIADLDTEIACCSGAWRNWCLDVRAGMRRDVALLWAQLAAPTAAASEAR